MAETFAAVLWGLAQASQTSQPGLQSAALECLKQWSESVGFGIDEISQIDGLLARISELVRSTDPSVIDAVADLIDALTSWYGALRLYCLTTLIRQCCCAIRGTNIHPSERASYQQWKKHGLPDITAAVLTQSERVATKQHGDSLLGRRALCRIAVLAASAYPHWSNAPELLEDGVRLLEFLVAAAGATDRATAAIAIEGL
eukprot:SAG31_NODE_7424_length_1691_cov_2.150754_1_plen_200_part_10